MATEKLKFKIELYATMWDKPPHAEIFVNNDNHFSGYISSTKKEPTMIEFQQDLEETKNHTLTIKGLKKDSRQTIINEKGDLLKDQLLHIKSISIDDIDIGALLFEGVYTPDYPEPWATQQRNAGVNLRESFKNVTALGFNGQWKFQFSSPFYMWLLENLY